MSVPAGKQRLWWRRVRSAMQESVRQQITLSGLFFTALALVLGLTAFISANNLLFLLFAALLSTLVISGLVSRLGLASLQLDLDLPEHISARQPVSGSVIITNNKWSPSFSIHLLGGKGSGLERGLYFTVLPARSRTKEPVALTFPRRGVYKEADFEFSSLFPFGFTRRRAQVTLTHDITVFPSLAPRAAAEQLLADLSGELESWYRGQGYDFYRIRPYEVLESSRHVDWRATAHTGELQVREFTREDELTVTVCLDLHADLDQAEIFEAAVETAAFLAWTLTARHSKLRLLTQTFDRTVPVTADVYDILRYLAIVQPVLSGVLAAPDESREPYIALTTRPEQLVEAGWDPIHVVDVAHLLPPADGPDGNLASAG